MFSKRIQISLLAGAVLGLVCILGGSIRLGFSGNQNILFALWYNRVLMGLVIGLAGSWAIFDGKLNYLVRGALLGTLVSAAYFFTSGMTDGISFLAGTIYGVIIELVLEKIGE